MMDIQNIRAQFPILQRQIEGNPLIYFDSGASSQKPQCVLDTVMDYYQNHNANVHRGIHQLSQEATEAMEAARKCIQDFIHAKETHEIIFARGTTEAINMVAKGLWKDIKPGDEILITELEHHANIVPWQMLCEHNGAKLKYVPLMPNGVLDWSQLDNLLTENTRLVAFNHVSNANGCIHPAKEIIQRIRAHSNALILIDGAQSTPHFQIDVQDLDPDFYAFSGHKMYAPTGVGVLYGKEKALERLYPMLGGGEMIDTVTMEQSTYGELPFRLEAGTPNISGNIAMKAAIDFMQNMGMEQIFQHDQELVQYTENQLKTKDYLTIYAADAPKSGAISFNMNLAHVHPSDVGMVLNKKGIAVRTGHHCAQPFMHKMGVKGTIRASFSVFNTKEEIDAMMKALDLAYQLLQ